MELLQIITFSLKLFALVTTIIVLSSYLIYKIKDRKRNRPYTKNESLKPAKEPAAPVMQYAAEDSISSPVINMPAENAQYIQYNNAAYETPYYGNAQYEPQPALAPVYQNSQPRARAQRFKILNEDNSYSFQGGRLMERLQPATVTPQRFNSAKPAQSFNIYDYYSSNNYEPMHKVSL